MILKVPDVKHTVISELEKIFLTADKEKQAAIAHELCAARTTIKNEIEAAYLINFHLRYSQNTIVIHDLHLKLDNGRIAHIEHLLIHRSYRFYILETGNFSDSVKINDQGRFQRWNDKRKAFEHIPSPIEKNERHSAVLRQALESLGLRDPHIQSFVLIAPHAHIDRPQRFDSELVVKADQFLVALNENLENASFLGMLTGSAQTPVLPLVSDIAEKLIALHRPVVIDYGGKIRLNEILPVVKNAGQAKLAGFKTIP